jgi:hypothetical protein
VLLTELLSHFHYNDSYFIISVINAASLYRGFHEGSMYVLAIVAARGPLLHISSRYRKVKFIVGVIDGQDSDGLITPGLPSFQQYYAIDEIHYTSANAT